MVHVTFYFVKLLLQNIFFCYHRKLIFRFSISAPTWYVQLICVSLQGRQLFDDHGEDGVYYYRARWRGVVHLGCGYQHAMSSCWSNCNIKSPLPQACRWCGAQPWAWQVLLPNHECLTMVVTLSSLIMLPARYGYSSSSFVCLMNIKEWQQGVTRPISIHTRYLSIFTGVYSHGCLNLGFKELKSIIISSSSNTYHLVSKVRNLISIYSDLLANFLSNR
jgi:hypothetical protein